MAAICSHYKMRPRDYFELTWAQHTALIDQIRAENR